MHDGEQRPEAPFPDGVQEGRHFLAADDVGQQLLAVELDILPTLPLSAQMVAVERAHGAQRLVDRRVFQLQIRLQMNQKFEDLPLAKPLDRIGLIELAQAHCPSEVRFAGAGLQISKLDKGIKVLVPRLRGDVGVNRCVFFVCIS